MARKSVLSTAMSGEAITSTMPCCLIKTSLRLGFLWLPGLSFRYGTIRGRRSYCAALFGGVVEWLMAPVLKTGEVKASVGSNPTPSVDRLMSMPKSLVARQWISALLRHSAAYLPRPAAWVFVWRYRSDPIG